MANKWDGDHTDCSFTNGEVLNDDDLNDTLEDTPFVPIGAVISWAKTITGVPALTAHFVECNGQTLSDADSPLDGEDIPPSYEIEGYTSTSVTVDLKACTGSVNRYGGIQIQDSTETSMTSQNGGIVSVYWTNSGSEHGSIYVNGNNVATVDTYATTIKICFSRTKVKIYIDDELEADEEYTSTGLLKAWLFSWTGGTTNETSTTLFDNFIVRGHLIDNFKETNGTAFDSTLWTKWVNNANGTTTVQSNQGQVYAINTVGGGTIGSCASFSSITFAPVLQDITTIMRVK